MDKKFNESKAQKYTVVALSSIYTLGILPAIMVLKTSKEAV